MLGALFALLAVPATAQSTEDDSDDIELDDEIDIDESDQQPAPPAAPVPLPPVDEEGPVEDEPPADEEDVDILRDDLEAPKTDLLGDENTVPVSGDTEADFRATQLRLGRLDADQEIEGWEQYLAQYPNSAYRTRIEARTEELMDELYKGGATPGVGGVGSVDALRAEIDFAQPLQLENINPRSRLELAFEWGLPSYMNLVVDYEHQLRRNVSVHAGIRRRYQGWNLEFGPRWAIVKSTRTQTLVTIFGDVHLNTNPVFPGFRPQVAVGKRFGKVHAQIQGGPDLELRTYDTADGTKTELQTSIASGANLYYAASERVGVFAEGFVHMKSVPADAAFVSSLYRFNVASFGLKFYPENKNDGASRNMEINFGATIPFMQQYWQFHYGSVMGQFNYYL